MTLFIVLLALIALVILIAGFKVNPFLAFLVVCVIAGLCLGIPLTGITKSVETGIGAILADTLIIIVIGAMLGKLIAVSGAAQQIATTIMKGIGLKNIHWALALIGLIIGIPLFYNTGFVLMIPLIFSIVYQYKLPAVPTGVSLLAALSVAHGFLPPHPGPVSLASIFNASIGKTMLYGLLVTIPLVWIAGIEFGKRFRNFGTIPLQEEEQEKEAGEYKELTEKIKEVLGEQVKDVRITLRLTESPACLVTETHDMSGNLERLLKSAGQKVTHTKPILEINPYHPMVERLKSEETHFADWSHILFDQALLAEGGQLDDPASFVKRINQLFLSTGNTA